MMCDQSVEYCGRISAGAVGAAEVQDKASCVPRVQRGWECSRCVSREVGHVSKNGTELRWPCLPCIVTWKQSHVLLYRIKEAYGLVCHQDRLCTLFSIVNEMAVVHALVFRWLDIT